MVINRMQNKGKRIVLASISFLIVAITNIMYMNFKWINIINSDASSEFVLAKLLNDEGCFISKQWFYSTELRVLNTQFINKIGLFVFENNWKYARCLAMALFMLLILLAAIYIGKQLYSVEFGLWAATIMIAPIGKWYANNIIYFSYYMPHVLISVISIALIMQISNSIGKKNIILNLALFILSIAGGVGGIRQIMICYLPLMLLAIFVIAQKIILDNNIDRKYFTISNGYLLSCVITLIGGCIGYVINHKLQYVYRFRSYEVMKWNKFKLSKLIDVAGDFLGLLGWNDSTDVIGIGGIGNAIAIMYMLILLGSILYFAKHYDRFSLGEKFIVLYFIAAFLVMLLCFSGIDTYNESYWLPIIPFAYLIMMISIKKLVVESELILVIKRIIYIGLAVSVTISCISTMYYPYLHTVVNYNKDRAGMTSWIVNHEYDKIVAPFWESNLLTELTNGKIEAWTTFEDLEIDRWLQRVNHAEKLPEGRVAVILEKSELTDNYNADKIDEYLVYEDDEYLVYDFDNIDIYKQSLSDNQ